MNFDGNTIINVLIIAGALVTNYVAISNRLVKLETKMELVVKKVLEKN